MSGDENLWYVKTADGDVHRVTLDQLDEAFQAGRIDGKVMVLAAGATKWQSLSDLAGLDEAPPPASPPTMPSSLRPVSMDLSLDLDENAFKKKSPKKLLIGGVIAVLALCGGVVASSRVHLGGDSSAPPVAAAVATPPAPPAPVAAPPPPPVVAAAPAPSPAPQLSDDQKQKLAAADKALQAKTHKKTRTVSGSGSHPSPKYKSQGFTTGGSKFDPLNASL